MRNFPVVLAWVLQAIRFTDAASRMTEQSREIAITSVVHYDRFLPPTAVCGNGVKEEEMGEACDDGNHVNGDGCSSTCLVEKGYLCTPSRFIDSGDSNGDYKKNEKLVAHITCPVGSIVEVVFQEANTEEDYDFITLTDDAVGKELLKYSGNSMNVTGVNENDNMFRASSNVMTFNFEADSDICLSGFIMYVNCIERSTGQMLFSSYYDRCQPICGDGLKLGGEQCDDGNIISGDGCSRVTCTVEDGYKCNPKHVSFVDNTVVMDQCLHSSGRSCDSNEQCASQYCSSSTCATPISLASTCHTHEECGLNAFCNASISKCAPLTVSHLACSSSRECEGGSCFNKLCDQEKRSLGVICESDANCHSNSCRSGVCSGKDNQLPCYIHTECASNYCEPDYEYHNLLNGTCLDLPPEISAMRLLAGKLNKGQLKDWSEVGLPCLEKWTGVTCNQKGKITAVKLVKRGLGSLAGVDMDLFALLDNLPLLQTIDLSENYLKGKLPSWKHLLNLQNIILIYNQIEGSLKSEWKDLVNLKVIRLKNNQIVGETPVEWRSLIHLERLNLAYNNLVGPLRVEWKDLVKLQYLYLDNNQLSGDTPSEWETLVDLIALYLDRNRLTGTLKKSWKSMINLEELNLCYNYFHGPLVAEWASMVNLKTLDLRHNQLNGTLVDEWMSMTKMFNLYLDQNKLVGTLHESWKSMVDIEGIQLSENRLEGSLPPSWSSMVKLQWFYASSNKLAGPLPSEYNSWVGLKWLDLAGNALTSTIPAWESLTNLEWVVLSNNLLTGPLREWESMVNLHTFYAGNNRLNSTLPLWKSRTNLKYLDLSTNQFDSTLPEEWNSMINIVELSLVNIGHIVGTLPAWNSMTNLTTLDVSQNNIQGQLPKSWGNMIKMKKLFMGGNNISDILPLEWKSMKHLETLDLSWNQLQGGNLTIFLGNLTGLVNFNVSGNALEGDLNSAMYHLPPSLSTLDVSSNKLTGPPPLSIFNVQPSLRWLNISDNTNMKGLPFPNDDLNDNRKGNTISKLFDASGIYFLCPLPPTSKYPSILFIKPQCHYDFSFLLIPVYAVAGSGLIAVSVVLLAGVSARTKGKKMLGLLFVAGIKMALLTMINGFDLYSDLTMYIQVSGGINEDYNVCAAANHRELFNPKMAHEVIYGGASQNYVNQTDFPNNNQIHEKSLKYNWNDFESYYHLSFEPYIRNKRKDNENSPDYIDWPGKPQDNIASRDSVDVFKRFCESMHRYPASDECSFFPGTESLPLLDGSAKVNFTTSDGKSTSGQIGCYRNYNPVLKEHKSFRYFFYVSIAIYGLKELYKLAVLVFVLVTGRNEKGRFSTILYASVGSPLLFVCRNSILQGILTYEATSNDVLAQLVLETVGENVLQLIIALYFSLYVQEIGIDRSVAWSFLSNLGGLLFKLATYIQKRRQAAVPSSEAQSTAPNTTGEGEGAATTHRKSSSTLVFISNPTAVKIEMTPMKK